MNLKVKPRHLINIARNCWDLKDQVKDLLWELKDARLMAEYSKWIMKKRWREAEEFIVQSGSAAIYYANLVLKRPWPDAEQEMIKEAAGFDLLNYAVNIKKNRWPEAEHRFADNFYSVIRYGNLALQKSFLEPFKEVVFAAQSPSSTFYLCKNFIHKRCDRSERIILKCPKHCVYYAKEIIKGRWPEAEEVIQTDPSASVDYACDVMKARWHEGEVKLYRHDNQDYWETYIKHFGGGLHGEKYFLETNPLLKDKP